MAQIPTCKKVSKQLTIHNHTRNDDYFWMNERDSEDVVNYIKQENRYTQSYFDNFKDLQELILDEFEERINPNDVSAPFILNKKTYQFKNQEGLDYSIIVNLDNEVETVFFNENERAENKSFYELADWVPSPNNELLAVSEDYVGRRKYSITFRNNSTNEYLSDEIKNTDGSIIWANDNKTVFYIKKDEQTLREFQVYRHEIGTSDSNDVLIYEELDERYHVYLTKSLTNQYIEINCSSSLTTETLLVDANIPSSKPILFLKREKNHIYSVHHHSNGFYILSNKNAKNNQLHFSKEIPTSIEKTQIIINHNPLVFLENLLVLENYLIIEERENGLQKVRILNNESKNSEYLQFEEETYFFTLNTNDDFYAKELYYSYNSLTTPTTVYKYNFETKEKITFFTKELLDKTFKPSNYESKRIWITANDGAKVAVTIVYSKGLELKTAPLLLYGYGSYGITYPDTFSAYRLSLLNRGFVFAIAHIRGEKYLGEEWYENGKFLKKKNTFTDFINVAEYLGMKGYCDKNRIYAKGGSAGGLLMGAVTNMAPYLWKGIIAQVPFVDVVTTMLDETIPLTVGEYDEWGNPNEEDYYYYMLSYSPYDNVKKMDYPAMYITTGYHDSQVQYWEPLKWVAKLRENKTNQLPLLFDCNLDAGHGGGSGRTNERLEIAKEYSFILNLEGINQ